MPESADILFPGGDFSPSGRFAASFVQEVNPRFGLFCAGVERIEHVQRIASVGADDFPVDVIRAPFLMEKVHRLRPDGGAGVGRCLNASLRDLLVRNVPDRRSLRQRQAKAAGRVDLMGEKKVDCGKTPEQIYVEMTVRRFDGVKRCC